MSGDTLAESELREQPECRGQSLLAMQSLFAGRLESGHRRRLGDLHFRGKQS